MNRITLSVFTLLALSFLPANGQKLKMKIANSEFKNMRYADAIVHYEQLLQKDKNNPEILTKLAECYRRTNDHQNEMRTYSLLAHAPNASPKNYWHYAQALATNGYYEDAVVWYQNYDQAMPNDRYAAPFIKAYSNMNQFYKDSADYQAQYIPSINSWQSDFSPAYYKGGLVFLSNRHQESIIRRVYELDQSSFLDFYFASDTALIAEELQRPSARYHSNKDHHRHDDYTITTSNDTHIPASYGKTYLFDSVNYHSENSTRVTKMSKSSNHRYHEGPLTFTKGQDSVFFTRNISGDKTNGQNATRQFAILYSYIDKGEWSPPKEVPFNGKTFSTGHPAFTPDNKRMYFASDRPGGKGGSDIYVVEYDHGFFSEPVNVEEINTPDNEVFPYVSADGTLFFSSDGLPGLGGLDLFRAQIENNKVVSFANAGYPINSKTDDFGIIWDKNMNKGFFSSNRKRGFTDDDIYSIEKLCQSTVAYVYDSLTLLPLDSVFVESESFSGYTDSLGRVEFCMKPGEHSFKAGKADYENNSKTSSQFRIAIPMSPLQFDLSGKIYSREDHSPIAGAHVTLINQDNATSNELTTDANGHYHFKLDTHSNYKVTVAKESCGTNTLLRSTNGLLKSQTLKGDMDMLCQGDIIIIENIYYDLNKHNIRPDAALELDKTVALMNQYPDMRVELRSHTDSRASDAFNMRLSTRRAQAVLDYMATKGVVPSRMRAAGYGESIPINKCTNGVKCTEAEFQQNRRTEFKVLSIK